VDEGYEIVAYTDGSCVGNPGPAGAGCAFFARKLVQVESANDSDLEDFIEEKYLCGA
jgi:ribonuclease HI